MTPLEIETQARNKYNSIGDSFFSSAEIMHLIWEGCQELALDSLLIERTYTTTTVAGTQEYAFPTSTIAIKRVTYNGRKLIPISMKEDDAATGLNQATTSTGEPQFYYVWNESLFLRPIPNDALALKIFSYNEAQQITDSSTMEIPSVFHTDLVNFVVSEMCLKDENLTLAQLYSSKWEKAKLKAKKWKARQKRTDQFGAVMDLDNMAETFLGNI